MVAAGVGETELGVLGFVEIREQDAMYERAEVEQLLGDLRRGADLAFGPEPVSTEQAELDDALFEVVERADTPTDVNRLVAAAIRLRKAHRALVRRQADDERFR